MAYEYHPVALSADTTDYQGNTLSRIGRAVSQGSQAAAVSGIMSIYNSFVPTESEVKIEDAVRRYGNDEMGDYYLENKNAIDVVGFAGASLIPGTLGMKGVQMLRGGNALGNYSKFLNAPVVNKAKYLEAALQETAQNGGAIKSILSANRLKYAGWEVADQAILGTAFEVAAAATMFDSPVFDGDSIGDFGWNIALGTGLSGAIGGAFGSIAAKGILKNAQSAIQAQMRQADVIKDPAKLGLLAGTETLAMAESIMLLPTQFDNIPFKYALDGKPVTTELQTAGAMASAKKQAEQYGTQQLQLSFNKLAGGDELRGQAYFEFMQTAAKASREAGLSPAETVQKLHGYLGNLEKVEALNLEQMALDQRRFYLTVKPAGATDEERFMNLISKDYKPGTTSKQAYRLADDVTGMEDLKIVRLEETGYKTQKDLFRAEPGIDAIQLPDGSLRINPKSGRVLRHRENPLQVRQLIDLESGELMTDAPAVIGDLLRKGGLGVQDDALYVNGKRYDQAPSKPFSMTDSPLEATARWAWASKLEGGRFMKLTNGTVDSSDFPMMERLAELIESKQLNEATLAERIIIKDGDIDHSLADIGSLRQFINTRRMEVLEKEFNAWKEEMGSVPSTSLLAASMNTDRAWIEAAIDRHFAPWGNGEEVVGKVLSTAESLKPRTLQATWNFGAVPDMAPTEAFAMNMGPSHLVTTKLTTEYQIATRRLVGQTAMDAVLGEDAALFLEAADDMVRSTSVSGAGASLFGAANAGGMYDPKRAVAWTENTGKNVSLVSMKNRDAVIGTLSPSINAIRENPAASAELSALTTALRKNPERFVFSQETPNSLISQRAAKLAKAEEITEADAVARLTAMDGLSHGFDIQDPAVLEFIRVSTQHNHVRQGKFTTLFNAAGLSRKLPDSPVVYVPPVNTVRYPFHAFVRSKEKIGLASDVSMITAKSAEQLRALAAEVGDDFDVFFKADTEAYFKIKGEYDYAATLNEASVNSALARKGKLADFFPETRFENVMEDWLMWHGRQEEKLVRDAVQVGNRQFFSELQHLSNQYRQVDESVARGIGGLFKKKVQDPFGDYIKTALNISKQQEFPLLDSLNDFVDKVGLAAGDAINKAFYDSQKGLLSWQEANKVMESYGLGAPYKDINAYITANEKFPRNVIRESFQKVNMALATTMLRFDFANSMVNMISTPIMLGTELASIKTLLARDNNGLGALNELLTLPVPGRPGVRVPSTTKLIGDAINNFFGADKAALFERYKAIGSIKNVNEQYHQMLELASFNPLEGASKFSKAADKVVELGAKISGNNFSEDFTRFVSADVMRQLSQPVVDAGKMTVKEQDAFISTFVNRVQGNYVTSQRPIVFQGTTGAAVSLFQTYAFNVLQQLHRHMEAGDKKTLLIFAGLQGSIFGLNGLPFFDAVNTHLIGSYVANNPEHKDAYSILPGFNKELGNWMLYGTASAFPLFAGSQPAVFTRGDMNPRNALILPTAIADVPAVSASIKLIDSVMGVGKNIMGGADVSDALLQGLEHQGWNRPLAGFAQLLAGQTTDNKGALVSASIDMKATSYLGALAERTFSAEGVSRLMGARPMDEAVALNAMYRNKAYQAVDRARIERLGEVVKTKMYNNEMPTDEEMDDFMLRYTRSGGRAENFNAAMQRWQRDSNVSIVNQMAQKQGSSYAQKLQLLMGGELPDYSNAAMQSTQQPME